MGSIADLLGDQLRAGLAQLVDPDADGDAPEAAEASSLGSSSATWASPSSQVQAKVRSR